MPDRVVYWRAFADFSKIRQEAAKTEVALKRLRSEVNKNNAENARYGKSEQDLGKITQRTSEDITRAKNAETTASTSAAAASKRVSKARESEISTLNKLKAKYTELAAAQRAANEATRHTNPVFGGSSGDISRLNQVIAAQKRSGKETASQIRAANALARAQTALKIAQDGRVGVTTRLNAAEERLAAASAKVATSTDRAEQATRDYISTAAKYGEESRRAVAADVERQRALLAQARAVGEARASELNLTNVRRAGTRAADDLLRAESNLRIATTNASREFRAAGGGGNIFTRSLRTMEDGFNSADRGIKKVARALIGIRWPLLAGGVYVLLGAVSALVDGLFMLGSAIAPAVGGLAAIGPVAFAAGAALLTLKAAFSGVGATLKAYQLAQLKGAQQSSKAANTELNNANAVISAQESLKNARQQVGITARQVAAQISDASQTVVKANQSELQAQKDLTQARIDAKRNIEDLKNAVIDAALAEKGATLDLADAQANLQHVMADPTASRADRERAKLQVQQAQQAQKAAATTTADAKKNARDAASAGVDGSASVIKAKQDLADATYQAAKAERDYVSAVQDGARQNKKALQDVADAQRQLSQAQRSASVSADQAGAAIDTYKQRLAQLTPAARKFVLTLISMQKYWKQIKDTASSNLFPGVESGMKRLLVLFPTVKSGIGAVARALGGFFDEFAKRTSDADAQKIWKDMFGEAPKLITIAGKVLINFFDIFTTLTDAAIPLTNKLGNGVLGWSNNLVKAVDAANKSGKLTKFFDHSYRVLHQLGQIAHNLGKTFYNLGVAAGAPGQSILDSIQNVTKGWETSTKKNQATLRKFFWQVRSNLREIDKVIGRVALAFLKMGGNKNLKPLIKGLEDIFNAIKQAFSDKGTSKAFLKLLHSIADAIRTVTADSSALKVFFNVLSTGLDILSGFLKIPRVAPIVGGIVAAFALFKGLKLLGAITGISRLGKAIGGFVKDSRGSGGAGAVVRRRLGSVRDNVISGASNASSYVRRGYGPTRRIRLQPGARYAPGISGEPLGPVLPPAMRRARARTEALRSRGVVGTRGQRMSVMEQRAAEAAAGTRGTTPIPMGGAPDARTPFVMGGARETPAQRRARQRESGRLYGPPSRQRPGSGARAAIPGEPVPLSPLDQATNSLIAGTDQRLAGGQPARQSRFRRLLNRLPRGDRGSASAGALSGRFFGRRATGEPTPRGGSRLGRVGRGLGVGAGIGIAVAGTALGDTINDHRGGARQAVGGAISGAAQGALLGSIAGPWGMAIGAGIGGIVGLLQNSKIGSKIAKWWKTSVFPMIKRLPQDFVKWGKDLLHWITWPFVTAFDWINKNVAPIGSIIEHIWNGISDYFKGLFTFWKNLFLGVFNIIKDIVTGHFGDIWKQIKLIWDGIWAYLKGVWSLIKNLAIATFEGIRSAIELPFKLAWAFVKFEWNTAWSFLKGAWNAAKGVVNTLFNAIGNAITSPFKTALDDIRGAWNATWTALTRAWTTAKNTVSTLIGNIASAAGTAWGAIEDAFLTPVAWVLQYVYNDGIVKLWDWVAPKIGLGTLSSINSVGGKKVGGYHHLSTGGIIPGYEPGVDTVPAMLSKGEGVLRPEVVRALGPDTINGWNAQARKNGKVEHFASGGIAGGLAGVGDAFSSVSNGLSSAVSKLLNAVNPMRVYDFIKGKWDKLKDLASGAMGSFTTGWGKAAVKAPATLIAKVPGAIKDKVLKWAESFIQKLPGGHIDGLAQSEYYPQILRDMHALALNPPAAGLNRDEVYKRLVKLEQRLQTNVGLVKSNPIDLTALTAPGGLFYPDEGWGYVGLDEKWHKTSAPKITGGRGTTGRNQNYARRAMNRYGWGGDQWQALNDLWNKESGWSQYADTRLTHAGGDGPGSSVFAYGIAQARPATKYPKAGQPADLGGSSDPGTQIDWGLNYIKNAYGSPNAAWAHEVANNWYAKGGIVPGVQYFHNGGVVGGLNSKSKANWALNALHAQAGTGWYTKAAGWTGALTTQLRKRLAGVSKATDVMHPGTAPTVENPLYGDSPITRGLMSWVDSHDPSSYNALWSQEPYGQSSNWPNKYHRNPLLPILSYIGGSKVWESHRKTTDSAYWAKVAKQDQNYDKKHGIKSRKYDLASLRKRHPIRARMVDSGDSQFARSLSMIKTAASQEKSHVGLMRHYLGLGGSGNNGGLFSADMQEPLDHAMAHTIGQEHPADWPHPWSGPVTAVETALAEQDRSNALYAEWYKDLNIVAGWGYGNLLQYLLDKGVSDGMVLLRSAVKDKKTAQQLDASIAAGKQIGGASGDQDTILKIISKLASGSALNPYGLRDVSAFLNTPDYSVVNLFDQMTAQLKTLPDALTKRFKNDVNLFRQGLFYANTGGIVPGDRGHDRDTQPAMLTPGEGVLNRRAMTMLGENNLHRLNNGIAPQMFNNGGVMLAPTFAQMGLGSAGSLVANTRGAAATVGRGATAQVVNINTEINNPVGENSVYSMTKNLQKQAHLGTIAKLTGNK